MSDKLQIHEPDSPGAVAAKDQHDAKAAEIIKGKRWMLAWETEDNNIGFLCAYQGNRIEEWQFIYGITLSLRDHLVGLVQGMEDLIQPQ